MPLPLLAIPAGIMTIITVVQLIFTILGILIFVVQLVAGLDFSLSFLTDVKGPAASVMETMYSYLTSFMPITIDGIFTTLDNVFSLNSSNTSFTPRLTFTGFMSTIAFTEVFNTVLMCLLNSLAFVLNVRFLRWSINRLRLRFS